MYIHWKVAYNCNIIRHTEVRGWSWRSFISGESVQNQKNYQCMLVPLHLSFVSLLHLCLWRDVWNAVSGIYYDVLPSYVDESSLLEPANGTLLFCAQHIFVPRIQEDLDTFTDGWNTHSLEMEHYLTLNQLWEMGMIHSPVC